MKNQINLLLTLVMIAFGFTASGAVGAEPPHPYHVSLAEVNWNAKSKKFEVALCLWPADLEKALAQQTGRPIDLAKEEKVDGLIQAYIAKRFTIHSTTKKAEPAKKQKLPASAQTATPAIAAKNSPAVQPPKMKWYGHEADAKQVWLYFEIAGDAKANWTAENRVFFELNDDQLNHVQWNGTGKTETLVCDANNAKIVLPKK